MRPEDVNEALARGAVILDVRGPRPFAEEHVPGAVNLRFSEDDLVDEVELALPEGLAFVVCGEPEETAATAVEMLTAGGIDVLGHLEGGLEGWKAAGLPTGSLDTLSIHELRERLGEILVVDARDPFEFKYGHVPGARLLPWMEAWEQWESVPDGEVVAVICGDEIRSGLVASILARHGRRPALVVGGLVDWYDAEYPVEKGEA